MAMGTFLGVQRGFAKAPQPRTGLDFEVPKGACDTHTHIFGDVKNFPLFAGRGYTPPEALPREMSALHRALRVERVVIVTPSVYGTDNAATLYGMRARRGTARGVGVIDERTPESALDEMGQAGVRGVRINLGSSTDAEGAKRRLEQTFDRVSRRGWHVQIFAGLPVVTAIEAMVMRAPVPVVVDHVASANSALGVGQPGFAALLRLVKSGKAYVKVTHRFLPSGKVAESAVLAKALLDANAARVLWGTDWPHPDSGSYPGRKATDVSPFEDVDDGLWLNHFARIAGKDLKQVMVENPATLYGF